MNFNTQPEKAKKEYEKIKEEERELKRLSKQFVEESSPTYTAYRKRPVPPCNDGVNPDRNQLKRSNISRDQINQPTVAIKSPTRSVEKSKKKVDF